MCQNLMESCPSTIKHSYAKKTNWTTILSRLSRNKFILSSIPKSRKRRITVSKRKINSDQLHWFWSGFSRIKGQWCWFWVWLLLSHSGTKSLGCVSKFWAELLKSLNWSFFLEAILKFLWNSAMVMSNMRKIWVLVPPMYVCSMYIIFKKY